MRFSAPKPLQYARSDGSRRQQSRSPRLFSLLLFAGALFPAALFTGALWPAQAKGQTSQTVPSSSAEVPADAPLAWVEAAAANELKIIGEDGSFPLRYRTRKADAKGDTTRELIDTRQGSVARLVERNGQPLTAAENDAEKQRLLDILASPSDFIKHHRRDDAARSYAQSLVRALPRAMLLSYAPGQPQLAGVDSPQVVVDFKPDPRFKPPTMVSELLTGIEGRLWIDRRTKRLVGGDGRVSKPVDMGWGVLAHIYPGGTIQFEQTDLGGGRWVYSHLVEHLRVREMLFKIANENVVETSSDFRSLPTPVSFQEAVHILLAMPVPTK